MSALATTVASLFLLTTPSAPSAEAQASTAAGAPRTAPTGSPGWAASGSVEEIAAAVLWLCSPGASYVVGQALTVDGGLTVP